MNEYDKFKKVKINNQNSSFNIIDSLNKSKFEQLKEISQKTKLKLNNKFYLDKTPSHIKSDFQPKRAHNKLKNYITNTKTDYSNYNKVPHKTKKKTNYTIDTKHNQIEIYPERASDTHCYNYHLAKELNNYNFDTDYKNSAKTINTSNSFKKHIYDDDNKYMISKILRSKLYNKGSKAKNDKIKPKIKIQINERKISLIKNIQNTKLKNKENTKDDLIENYLILKNEYKSNISNNYNINDYSHILYIIDDEENNIYQNIGNTKRYAYKNDYDLIINNKNNKNIDAISIELLKLNERKWLDELDDISNFLINNREILDDTIYNKYLRQLIKINEHFNWLVNSISKYFNYIFYQNENGINNNYNLNNIDLPKYENIWFKGFKWKGLFIRVVPYDKSKFIINEVKALNYFFLDYIQIIDGYKNFQNNKNPLSNYIIFPLISYSEINGFVLYASTLINFEQNLFFEKSEFNEIQNIIKENNGYIQLYSNMNNSSYYLKINKNKESDSEKCINDINNKLFINKMEKIYDNKDLAASKLFSEINIYHFIKIQKEKFLIFNVNEFIPKLFMMKFGSILNLNIVTFLNNSKKDLTIKYDLISKKILNNNHKQIFQNLLEMKTNSNFKKKEINIFGIQFRILYESQNINNKNYKTKSFVDYLFNCEKKNNQERNNFSIFKYETYINEPYIIIYDLIEPIKIKYSLIRNKYNSFNSKGMKNIKDSSESFYLNSNYMSYFINWCKFINNNIHITSYNHLKQIMKKYGIESNLKHLILFNIDNKDISDIIKISFLVKAIKYIINKKETDNLLDNFSQKSTSIYSSKSSLYNNSLNEIRKEMILYSIQSILYPNEVLSINKSFVENLYQNLVFFTKILFIKFKLIHNYMSLNESFNIVNKYSTPKVFLKQIIKCSRKKPFLFIKELQSKFNFVLNPYILFKSSLSIESMKNKLDKKYIYLNYNNNTYSYLNNEEISDIALTKIIYNSETFDKIKNIANKSIKFGDKYDTDVKVNLNYMNSFNYYENESPNSTYDSRKNNVNENITLLTSKLNISDSLTKIPKINEEYDVLYENNYLNEIINDIIKDFNIQLQPNCYKMIYNSEILDESFYNKNNNDYSIYKNLKPCYKISDIKILFNWFEYIENTFSNIFSFNGKTQHLLIKSYIIKFILYFFVEKSLEKSKNILAKIKQIYNNGIGYIISLNDLAILNLFEGLINEKNDDLNLKEKESFFSKSLILFLMIYGDPRGRKNDSNEILLLPIYKILNIISEIEKDSLIIDYFKEIFLCLEFNIKSKNKFDDNFLKQNFIKYNNANKKSNMNNKNKNEILIDSLNIGFKNKNIIKDKNNEKENINYILNNNLVNEEDWKYFSFPLINFEDSKDNSNLSANERKFYSKEFVIYFLKVIYHSITYENEIILDEQYIKENISNDILLKNNNIVKDDNSNKKKENNVFRFFKKSSSQKSLQILKTETKETKKINKNSSETKIKRTNSGLYNNYSHFLHKILLEKLSYKLNSPSGIVISFGNNTHFETCLDQPNSITPPHLIYKLKNKIIEHIYAGWEHNIIITKKGKIFSFGHNQCYQCGYPNIKNQESIKNPINISKINNNIKAISASCGNEHSLILSDEHVVYSFGSNEDGILGIKKIKSYLNQKNLNNTTGQKNDKLNTYKLNKIDFGEYTNKIIEISSGTVHNLALTYDGKIFSWGSSQGGQLGLSLKELESYPGFKNNYYISYPIHIPLPNNSNIIKISCGEAHSLALTNEGKVYSWGFGSNGQLGLGFCEDSFEPGEGLKNSMRYEPELIKNLEDEKIYDIKCGKTFSMFVDNKGELYSCGVNDLYQLGIQEINSKEHLYDKDEEGCCDFVFPTKVDYFLKMKVECISCGEGHCLAVIKDILSNTQTIWSWGNNKFGQLGQNTFIKKCFPRPINCLFEYNLFKFEEVACGGFHSLCLIKHKKNTNWIEDEFEKIICSIINDIGII